MLRTAATARVEYRVLGGARGSLETTLTWAQATHAHILTEGGRWWIHLFQETC